MKTTLLFLLCITIASIATAQEKPDVVVREIVKPAVTSYYVELQPEKCTELCTLLCKQLELPDGKEISSVTITFTAEGARAKVTTK